MADEMEPQLWTLGEHDEDDEADEGDEDNEVVGVRR